MADNNNTSGIQGHSNPETKLKADGTPDHRFKEVSLAMHQVVGGRQQLMAERRWYAR